MNLPYGDDDDLREAEAEVREAARERANEDSDLHSAYVQNGFRNRIHYLQTLRDEYGALAVDTLSSVLPETEDFDGLVTMLEEHAELVEESDDTFSN